MSEDHEEFRRKILEQREIAAIKALGLPYLKAGMSHRAAQVVIKRARRSEEVRQRILKAWAEERARRPKPQDPAEGAARALFAALDSGGEQERRAREFLKTAHPRIKEKMLEIAGATSEFKQRRSNKPNGF